MPRRASCGLPEVGRSGASGTASLLSVHSGGKGLDAQLAFLFAVFENPQTHVQSIYYRGETAQAGERTELLSFDGFPSTHSPRSRCG